MVLTTIEHFSSRTIAFIIVLVIIIFVIAVISGFNFIRQLSQPPPGTEDISEPIDWSTTQQYEGYELNYEGMILERGVGIGNITSFLEKRIEVADCYSCSSCTGIDLKSGAIGGTDIYNCSGCGVCNEKSGLIGDANLNCIVNMDDLNLCNAHKDQNWPPCDWDNNGIVNVGDLGTVGANMGSTCSGGSTRFKNCWGCTNTTGFSNENCTLCDDMSEEYEICKKLKSCILEHYADKSYQELHGCLIGQTPFNESASFDLAAFQNILKSCRSESIKINIGNNFSKELCYFNASSISYYDFQRSSEFYLVDEGYHENPGGTANIACIHDWESGKELTPFHEENGELVENYRIYVAINATPNEKYSVRAGYFGVSSPGSCSNTIYTPGPGDPNTVLGIITTDANGFGYATFDELPQKWKDDVKADPKKNKITGVLAFRNWAGIFGKVWIAFYAKDIGSNLEWTNELRYSNCNFNTNIEPYLKNKSWWADNDKIESSWALLNGNPNSSIKVFYDSSMPAGGNSVQRGNLKIQLGRLDTNFLRECKFDMYVCSQDAFAESEDDGILALSDFFTNFNPANVYTTINDGNKEIILYNYFEFNLDKPYDIEEIRSAIKTGVRLWETNKFLYDTSSTGLEWLKNNDGIYSTSWNEITGGPSFNEDCWNSDVTNFLKNGYEKFLIGNCPNNNCTEKLRIRVAFKYVKPDFISPLRNSLYPTITFCSVGSNPTKLPFGIIGTCEEVWSADSKTRYYCQYDWGSALCNSGECSCSIGTKQRLYEGYVWNADTSSRGYGYLFGCLSNIKETDEIPVGSCTLVYNRPSTVKYGCSDPSPWGNGICSGSGGTSSCTSTVGTSIKYIFTNYRWNDYISSIDGYGHTQIVTDSSTSQKLIGICEEVWSADSKTRYYCQYDWGSALCNSGECSCSIGTKTTIIKGYVWNANTKSEGYGYLFGCII